MSQEFINVGGLRASLYSLLAFLVASALGSLPAVAQDTDQQQMAAAGNTTMPRDAESIRLVQELGLCAARVAKLQSRLVLRGYSGSAASDKALFWTMGGTSSCPKGDRGFGFSPRSLRGPVAEYYLKRDFHSAGWMAKNRPLTLYPAPDANKLQSLPADVRANIILVEIGSCVAKADPAGVSALFATSVTSAEEKAAFGNLSTALSNCLPPAVELKMSKFQLRGFLAEGTYRAAAASKTGLN